MSTEGRESLRSPEQPLEYKTVVEKIKSLNWENLDNQELQQLMYLSHVSAREFAEALRIALKLYPENENLQEMARGELQTNNLSFGDYQAKGDHADYLGHFLEKMEVPKHLTILGDLYQAACRELDDKTRAMSIFSREEELSGIFERILKAKDWSTSELTAFRHYLEQHIAFDSNKGGHHDLTKEFPIDDSVKPFYEARLNMYRAIPKLFEAKSEMGQS